jgi:outer membrane receptor for ferrienterochelin and colicin
MFKGSRPIRIGQSVFAIALTAAALLAGPPLLAQQADDSAGRLQEIVVSATKVGEQEISKVPMAIQAFSGESLLSKGIADAKSLMELIPGASEQSEIGAGYTLVSVRGSGAVRERRSARLSRPTLTTFAVPMRRRYCSGSRLID